MAEAKNTLLRRASRRLDGFVEVFSPAAAYRRNQYRMAYDAIDNSRTRKKRRRSPGTGDAVLKETDLAKLRDIARDLSINNPIAKGLLKIERDGVVGNGVIVKSNTGDDKLDAELDAAWKEEMIDLSCEVTGRYNFHQYIRKAYLTYRRDGDFLTILTNDGLQAIEGEQVGTPFGSKEAKHFDVINGVAFSKKTRKLIGYYIGKPNKWGYIQSDSVQNYLARDVYHMFNADRFSQSRGEPALTASVTTLDELCEYMEAELVAAKVNACFSMFISKNSEYGDGLGDLSDQGVSSTGYDEKGNRLEKMEPGTILYGEEGETANGIGMTHPGTMFEPFVNRMLTIIGGPLCMPLMLITGDFSGATFMNARIAYQKVQETWETEQNDVLKPMASRIKRWHTQRLIDRGEIEYRKGIFGHFVRCRRWPYVDPYKEAMGDKVELANGTTNQTLICARKGLEFDEVAVQGGRDKSLLKTNGLIEENQKGMQNGK